MSEEIVEEGGYVDVEDISNIKKLNKVQPPFTILILGNIGLWAPKPRSKIALREPSVFPGLNEKPTKAFILRAEYRFRHANFITRRSLLSS